MDIPAKVRGLLVGRKLSGVQKREYDWVFEFGTAVALTAECPWRILTSGIAFTDSDDGQQFGLPAPLDGVRESLRLLSGRQVQSVSTHSVTGDLAVAFEDGTTLELLNLSSGYEGWQLDCGTVHIVAQGGGEVVTYSEPDRSGR
ncbi:MAG TPA: hypothetical protein VHU18_01720 [Rhizomicrobium sp.]|nr:hypothetical protein [Rhizomicrobium sp.]